MRIDSGDKAANIERLRWFIGFVRPYWGVLPLLLIAIAAVLISTASLLTVATLLASTLFLLVQLVSMRQSWRLAAGLRSQMSAVEAMNSQLREAHAQNEAKSDELQKALALQRNLARLDGLTGVLSYAAIIEEIESRTRREEAFAVVMADLDALKPLNDEYGHQAGDAALIAVARALAGEGVIAGRYGGDEFLCLLVGADPLRAETYVAGVKATVAKTRISNRDGVPTLSIGVSLGVAFYPQDGRSVADVVAVADEAMYEAKKTCREQGLTGPGMAGDAA